MNIREKAEFFLADYPYFLNHGDEPVIDAEPIIRDLLAEVMRLQKEVVNRNQRALDGDKAVAVRDKLLDENERLLAENERLEEHYTLSENLRTLHKPRDFSVQEAIRKTAEDCIAVLEETPYRCNQEFDDYVECSERESIEAIRDKYLKNEQLANYVTETK